MNVFDIIFLLLYIGCVLVTVGFIVFGLVAAFRKEDRDEQDAPMSLPRSP